MIKRFNVQRGAGGLIIFIPEDEHMKKRGVYEKLKHLGEVWDDLTELDKKILADWFYGIGKVAENIKEMQKTS
ncbi:hypothetical protein DRH14_02520 [Candidatus Shapirobacteria bacterium]|nr:MAG: hypothetical protein DRH14_02520 [Candidatus Shapirobacteria bacterium]